MSLTKRAEKKAAKRERKRQDRLAKQRQKEQKEEEQRIANQIAQQRIANQQQQLERALNAFWASPAGEARRAFRNGDQIFQFSIGVLDQQAIIVAMAGNTTSHSEANPAAILNSICREGWELVNGDFVFVMRGRQSRYEFMSLGRNVAVAGTVMGYYLFRRNEALKLAETDQQLRRRFWGQIAGTK